MLDVLNEDLIVKGEDPVAFDHDCREGICGMCGAMVNGVAHGPLPGTTLCQLHMRHFKDGDELYLEPWRARAFPVIKDLVVDRSAFDRMIAAGGFISASTGSAPDGNAKAEKMLAATATMGKDLDPANVKEGKDAVDAAKKAVQLAIDSLTAPNNVGPPQQQGKPPTPPRNTKPPLKPRPGKVPAKV